MLPTLSSESYYEGSRKSGRVSTFFFPFRNQDRKMKEEKREGGREEGKKEDTSKPS